MPCPCGRRSAISCIILMRFCVTHRMTEGMVMRFRIKCGMTTLLLMGERQGQIKKTAETLVS